MRTAFVAGFTYYAAVFAAGFILGVARTLVLAPQFGNVLAVIIELPFMLAISWAACGWAVRHFSVSNEANARIAMGAVAFFLLTATEIALALMFFGRSIADQIKNWMTAAGALGLSGQIAFALLPVLRRASRAG